MKLTDFKVLAFDVYGTLIDWESGMVNALKPLTDKVSQHLSRDDILEAHAYHESTTQRWTPAQSKHAGVLRCVGGTAQRAANGGSSTPGMEVGH